MEFQKLFDSMGDGATNQKELSRTRIADTRLLTPPRPLQALFADFARSASAQIQTLTTQNEKLAQARDHEPFACRSGSSTGSAEQLSLLQSETWPSVVVSRAEKQYV